MILLSAVKKVLVPSRCIDETLATLSAAGEFGAEAFALWAGRQESEYFRVNQTLIPRQQAYRLPTGVCVSVAGEELHRINVWLHESNLRLIAQIHSHPTDAYHSDTDDTYPLVATVGAFSIVVPDFGKYGFVWDRMAFYRLSPQATWEELSRTDINSIFVIED